MPAKDEGGELQAVKTRGVPEIEVEVSAGNVVGHDGKDYEEGEKVKLDGPTAIALLQAGHVSLA